MSIWLFPFLETLMINLLPILFRLLAQFSSLGFQDWSPHFPAGCQPRPVFAPRSCLHLFSYLPCALLQQWGLSPFRLWISLTSYTSLILQLEKMLCILVLMWLDWVSPNNPEQSPCYVVHNLDYNSKVPLSCIVTYSQDSGITAWTYSGRHSVYHR